MTALPTSLRRTLLALLGFTVTIFIMVFYWNQSPPRPAALMNTIFTKVDTSACVFINYTPTKLQIKWHYLHFQAIAFVSFQSIGKGMDIQMCRWSMHSGASYGWPKACTIHELCHDLWHIAHLANANRQSIT